MKFRFIIILYCFIIFYDLHAEIKFNYSGNFIFPESDKKIYKYYEANSILYKLNEDKPDIVRYAINEIYARKGYIFKTQELKDYFNSKEWYKPQKNKTIEINEIEERNIAFFKFLKERESTEFRSKADPSYISQLFTPKLYNLDKIVLSDLNYDNKLDSIKVSKFKKNNYLFHRLEINSSHIDLHVVGGFDKFAIIDIDTKDNFIEIFLCESGPSDDYCSYFFSYDANEIIQMGNVDGTYKSGMKFDGAGTLVSMSRGKLLQTWFFEIPYILSEKHQLIRKPNIIFQPKSTLFLLKDLKLFTNRNEKSKAFTLKKYQTVIIDGTDDKKWLHLKALNGKEGWFYISNGKINDTAYSGWKYFDGLCAAD